MEYFEDDRFNDENKRDTSFNVLASVRDALSLALQQQPPTYEMTLKYIEDIDPDLHESLIKYVPGKNESELVRRFKQKGKALNQDPQELIKKEISDYSDAVKSTTAESAELKKYIKQLHTALQHFKTRELTEHKLLNHDFYIAERTGMKEVYRSANYKDYALPNGNHFRIYLAHPDKVESVLGSDLIYEQYDLRLGLVRFAHLQYKTWNDKTLYVTERDKSQFSRLHSNTCKEKHCEKRVAYSSADEYRFPYCSAFLRPTSKLVNENSKMRSSGEHIPLCKVLNMIAAGEALRKERLLEYSIGHTIFDNLFNKYHIGSGWMPIGVLEEYYKKRNLAEMGDNVRILAQEVLHYNDEQEEPPN